MCCFFGELVANCLINSVADGTTLPGIKKARGTKLMFLNLRISLLIFSNFKCIVVFLASFASSGHKLALEFKYFSYKKVLLSLNHLLWCQDQRRHQCWLNFNVIGYVKHYLRQRFLNYCSACVYVRSFHSWANGLLLNFLHNVCLQLTCGGFVFAAFLPHISIDTSVLSIPTFYPLWSGFSCNLCSKSLDSASEAASFVSYYIGSLMMSPTSRIVSEQNWRASLSTGDWKRSQQQKFFNTFLCV